MLVIIKVSQIEIITSLGLGPAPRAIKPIDEGQKSKNNESSKGTFARCSEGSTRDRDIAILRSFLQPGLAKIDSGKNC